MSKVIQNQIRVMQAFLAGCTIIRTPINGVISDTIKKGTEITFNWEVFNYELPKIDFDWSQVDERYQWIAMDANGEIHVHERSPRCLATSWGPKFGDKSLNVNIFGRAPKVPEGMYWRYSVSKRPANESDCGHGVVLPQINWDKIEPGFNWFAVDLSGGWLFKHKPEFADDEWFNSEFHNNADKFVISSEDICFPDYTPDEYKYTLVQRPMKD